MDAKLDSLIDKIKKEGIDEAKKASDDILRQAGQQADQIKIQAKAEADAILAKAKTDSEKLKANAQDALRQAARDLMLSVKNELKALFDGVFKTKISGELKPEFMAKLITKTTENWQQDKKPAAEVIVSEADKKELEKILSSQLKENLKKGIEIKVNKYIDKGFRIGIKGKDVYYDFTEASILEALGEFINPAIAEILNSKNG
ncbi:MAG: hypothetical protein PHU64_02915 [Candidatus Omnitrophica bacterium]|nr:hypothetical protein [Candidatus Omnitrophota bacterium]MDD5429458.1 hypothetical protein [Candidatus Omnitrophota bacterium]